MDEALTCLREELAPLFSSAGEGRERGTRGGGGGGGSGNTGGTGDGDKDKEKDGPLGPEKASHDFVVLVS